MSAEEPDLTERVRVILNSDWDPDPETQPLEHVDQEDSVIIYNADADHEWITSNTRLTREDCR